MIVSRLFPFPSLNQAFFFWPTACLPATNHFETSAKFPGEKERKTTHRKVKLGPENVGEMNSDKNSVTELFQRVGAGIPKLAQPHIGNIQGLCKAFRGAT